MANETITYGGPGFCTLLGIAFIVLKLCNVITWSWWWVLAPFWIPIAIIIAILLITGLSLGIVAIISIWKS